MKRFIGTKVVRARQMTRGDYNALRGWTVPANEDGNDAGYLVEYVDGGAPNHGAFAGYISWSPKAQFEAAYRETSGPGVSFSMALDALKRGHRVARLGWNGKGMWLGLHTEGGTFVREECGTEITFADYITMKTADNKLVPWLASQTDMLAEDWTIV